MSKKRTQKFVDSHVQGALIRRILTHWFLFFGATIFLVATMNALNGDPSLPFAERVAGNSGTLFVLGATVLCLLPVFALDTVRFSNRFVGPITRLRRALRELGEFGKVEHLKFRGGDFWAELADEFNQVADLVKQNNANSENANSDQEEIANCK